MRWPHKYKDMPKVGTTRTRVAFLFLPHVDTDQYWRWLELAMIKEIWDDEICYRGGHIFPSRTENYKWRFMEVLAIPVTPPSTENDYKRQDLTND
jgi:hypothetical protein